MLAAAAAKAENSNRGELRATRTSSRSGIYPKNLWGTKRVQEPAVGAFGLCHGVILN